MGGAKDAQCRGDIGARANGCVLETAHEAGVNVLGHPGKGGRCHVRKSGEEAIGSDDALEVVMPY
jgi:hypothetical protein